MKKDNRHIDENLLMRYLLGEAGKQEQQQVTRWLELSEANRKHLDKLEAVWFEAGKIKPAPVPVEVHSAWDNMSVRVDKYEEEKKQHRSKVKLPNPGVIRYISGAAAVIILFFALFQLFKTKDKAINEIMLASTDHILKDTLPDGSQVALNATSKLVYPEMFQQNVRQVTLEGEAFFTVKHDPEKPFIIRAGEAYIKVLGTSFNVKAYPGRDVEVIVTNGSVNLYKVDSMNKEMSGILLKKGTKGRLVKYSENPEIADRQEPDEIYWMSHTLIFQKTDLRKVFELLEKYYHVNIELKDSHINDYYLTTMFTNNTIDEILEVIKATFNLEVKKENNTYIIKANDVVSESE